MIPVIESKHEWSDEKIGKGASIALGNHKFKGNLKLLKKNKNFTRYPLPQRYIFKVLKITYVLYISLKEYGLIHK